jgi:hypothetical protein
VFDLHKQNTRKDSHKITRIYVTIADRSDVAYLLPHIGTHKARRTPSDDISIQPKGFSVETDEIMSSALINTYAAASASKKVISSLADILEAADFT